MSSNLIPSATIWTLFQEFQYISFSNGGLPKFLPTFRCWVSARPEAADYPAQNQAYDQQAGRDCDAAGESWRVYEQRKVERVCAEA